MGGLSPNDVMLLQSSWNVVLAITTLGILWNARNRSVYFWCLSGIFGAAYNVLSTGSIAQMTYPTFWGQTIVGLSLIIGIALKAAAVKLMTADPRLDARIKAAAALALILIGATALEAPRNVISVLIVLITTAFVAWLARDVFTLGKQLQLANAKLFALVMGFQSVAILILTLLIAADGTDALKPTDAPLSIGLIIYGLIISLINSGLFISLVLDLNIRQRETMRQRLLAAEVERSRLEERQELLADMHDGFGSQLITAKMQAEKGELSQSQLVDLLQECMGDLHLVLDGLKTQDGDLAETLRQYRHRTERRLAQHHILLLWQIDLHDAPPLSPKATVNLLRIIQEAINNALKHAQAHKIIISAHYGNQDGFTIRVEDDGHGMPSELSGSQGLASMRRRARQLGATLTLSPRDDGTGTIVELSRLRSDH